MGVPPPVSRGNSMIKSWVLASGSPRRKEILDRFGIPFSVLVTDADENTAERDPARLAEELSARKGRAAREALRKMGKREAGQLVIASDTTVHIGEEILGKPQSTEDAERMLFLLQGKIHRVVSGIYLAMDEKEAVSHEVTEVEFAPMTKEEIKAYIASGEPFGKAGAYAVQGIGARFVKGIRGDYFNVVGLPVYRMCELLRSDFGEDFLQYVSAKK